MFPKGQQIRARQIPPTGDSNGKYKRWLESDSVQLSPTSRQIRPNYHYHRQDSLAILPGRVDGFNEVYRADRSPRLAAPLGRTLPNKHSDSLPIAFHLTGGKAID